ncbi:MAG: hypothetical protein JWN73_4904 [Betaproteobacteria bacterium]|nr:hypothetical protein [Betaproteobacteria bacterium]
MSRPPETARFADPADPASGARVAAGLARHWRRTRWLTAALLVLWLGATFGIGFFARDLERIHFFGWPLSYYMGAQGSLLIFLLIIGIYALEMRRFDREATSDAAARNDTGAPR